MDLVEEKSLSEEDLLRELESRYRDVIRLVGENPSREGLLKTPMRAAKALQYLTEGYSANLEEIVNQALFTTSSDGMVIVRSVEFYSLCEHHMLPFYGTVDVGYMPNKRVIGVSKIPRIIDMYARRLQIQENLGNEIGSCLMDVMNPHGVAVNINAKHMCMCMRGVSKQNSSMQSTSFFGRMKESQSLRKEFLSSLD